MVTESKKSSKHAGLLDFSFLPFRGITPKIMERTGGFSERTGRIFGFSFIRTDEISFLRHYS